MQIGILKEYNEEEIKKAEKENRALTFGIEPSSLLDQINIIEAQTQCNSGATLAAIKVELLQIMGKVEIKQENKNV